MKKEKDMVIATLGSHSALQILKGAKEEGFKTLAIVERGRETPYKRFRVCDETIVLESFKNITDAEVQEKLLDLNAIIIPHGSFVAYLGIKCVEEELQVPMFGNRKILRWEADRKLERKWLEKSNLKIPKEYNHPKEVENLAIVKFPGARGGEGYFLLKGPDSFHKKAEEMVKMGLITEEDFKDVTIQEYIPGVNFYLSYFYSPLRDEVELFGIDVRYETNVDGLTRIPAKNQLELDLDPTYIVVGNSPIVVREALLQQVFEMGDRVVEASKELCPPGIIGPFCIETVCTEKMEFITFEISARIVAGTNLYVGGSPYSYLLYGENVSMGRRIAMEIKKAIEMDRLEDLIS
ncbi:MAG: formate--phosphoribosylaminoimidazolecarboxamide ligase [Candidatus Hydrothermarchaeota archaeon]